MEKSQTHKRELGQVGSPRCSRHDSPLNTFCCTDEKVICAVCASTEHIGHTFGPVREERRMKQDELKRLKKRCQELLQRQDCTNALVREKARETEDFCEAVLTKVIDQLQTCYMSLRGHIQALERGALSAVQAQGTAEVKRRCSQIDRLAHIDSDVHFLMHWPSVHQHCKEDLTEFTDHLQLPFVSLQNSVDSFGNHLEEFCLTRFTAITKNAPGVNPLVLGTDADDDDDDDKQTDTDSHDVDDVTRTVSLNLKTRADFLQYACDLTLDPSTAHKDLLLSRNLKEVKLSPKSARGPAVRCPERFLTRKQILCREGLQADRCYYEVEVTGGQAEIALAYKTIDRKSLIQSAFGGNEKSWSLDRTSKCYSVSHKGESVELTSVPEHKRIGVYLKFREGTVSFYEVSDTMKFLYTKEDDFREPLYPGFWVGENCCIKICDLTNYSGEDERDQLFGQRLLQWTNQM
ncbi:tripartite motif-containing protein 16-like [Eucyclogobius newberryi]|uniref:tripartite motif-containing protein 16-like n=1 Tax=Eucyclogobius newberryi TaxID=166745 RepID=UPI003B5BF0AF